MFEKMNKEEAPKEELVFDQTDGGMYDSFPSVEDVAFELGISEEENEWEKEANDKGHGEYIRNVVKAVDFCKNKGVKTREEIKEILKNAKIENS